MDYIEETLDNYIRKGDFVEALRLYNRAKKEKLLNEESRKRYDRIFDNIIGVPEELLRSKSFNEYFKKNPNFLEDFNSPEKIRKIAEDLKREWGLE